MTMNKKGAKVSLAVQGATTMDSGFPMGVAIMGVTPDHDLTISAAAGSKCMANPFGAGCKATLKVSGTVANAAIAAHEFKYTASRSMLKFAYISGGQWQFKAQIKLLKYYVINYMCRASNVMSMTHFLTLPSPDAFPDIQAAIMAYVAPFQHYFMNLFDGADTVAHGVTYADTTLGYIQGKNFFDCSAIVVAVGFECPPLAEAIGANPALMQNFMQDGCAQFNAMMEGFAAQGVQPVQEARAYVASLTGPAGY